MKKLLTSLTAAVVSVTAVVSTAAPASAQTMYRPPHHGGYIGRHHDGGIGPGGAAALGIVGGLVLGSMLAQPYDYGPGYYYEDEPVVVRRRPVRVYEDTVVVRRARTPHCRTTIRYDMYGRPFEWKDCN